MFGFLKDRFIFLHSKVTWCYFNGYQVLNIPVEHEPICVPPKWHTLFQKLCYDSIIHV